MNALGVRAWPAVASIAAMVFLAGATMLWRRPTSVGPQAGQVHALLANLRKFEPRLAVSSPYKRLDDRSSPPAQSDDIQTWTTIANLERFAQAPGREGAHASAALGLAALYRGNADTAVEMLRDAVYLDPDEATYWCDLAAASLVRARPTDLLVALDSEEMSLQRQPNLESALFNRALTLERLGLLELAKDAWQAFPQAHPAAGWADEARDHFARVEKQLRVVEFAIAPEDVLRASPDQLGDFARRGLDDLRRIVEEELVPRLTRVCSASSQNECTDLLKRIQTIGAAMAEASPDREVPALAEELARWGPAELANPKRADSLSSYARAVHLFQQDQVQQSVEIFRSLADKKAVTPASLRSQAALYECFDYYYRSDHDHARSCSDRLGRQAARDHLLLLQGRIEGLRSQVSLTEGNLERASAEFDRTIAFYAEARDRNRVADGESLRATLLDQLGSLDDAWRDRISALSSAHLELRRRHTALNSGARSALLQRLFRAALVLEEAAVRNATKWGQPGALVETLLNRAVILQRLGRTNDALSDLQQARAQFLKVSDPRARSRFEGELTVMEGEILSESAPRDALRALQKASDTLTSMQFDMMRARVEYARGVSAERIGNQPEASAAYRRGVDVIERQRDALSPATQMQSVDLVWDMYERLFIRRLEDDGNAAAFASAEASRARVLRRFLPVGAPNVPPLSEIPAHLPPNTALLYFVVTEHETIRWLVSRAGVEVKRFPIERDRLDYQVRQIRRALTVPAAGSTLTVASGALHDLVAPPHDRLPRDTRLIVFPDGPLHDLPFAAVLDVDTGRYLIQDYPVGIAPSVRLFLAASRSGNRFSALDSVLVVKGRTGPGQPPLAPLPSADDEVQRIRKTYAGARFVSDETATPNSFLTQAGAYSIVHFTGHAIADRRNPEMSRLFLRPSPSDPRGWLMVRDLDAASFDRTAVVVLAACETGAGRVFRGEGVVSLARPFLGKGVAGVVSSLWEVDDSLSAELLVAFHSGIRSGLEPIEALQQAQRTAIENGGKSIGRPPAWAAFQYVGGLKSDNAHRESGGSR